MSEPKRRRITRQLLSEADFHERLDQFFRTFVSVRPVDWSCIRKSVTHFTTFFRFDEFSDLYFDYVFGLFEDFRITDRAVIDFVFTEYYRFKLRSQEYKNYLSLVPRQLHELPSKIFLYNRPSLLMRILRYVAPIITEWKDLSSCTNFVTSCFAADDFVRDHKGLFHFKFVDVPVGCSRRFQLIVMAVNSVLQVRIFNFEGAIKGLRLFFKAIPDPYVTWQEIFGFLMLMFSSSESIPQSFIQSFRESCERCFPECARVLKPRSLKHLARCEVRKCLSAAQTLPHGVWGLGIPRELEDYILLQKRRDQFRPVIRPLSSERVFAVGPIP